MRKAFPGLFFAAFFFAVASGQESNFYVSSTGDDAFNGTSPSTAFATLERAKQAVRLAKESNQNISSVNVFIKGGDYQLNAPLVFEPVDSDRKSTRLNSSHL